MLILYLGLTSPANITLEEHNKFNRQVALLNWRDTKCQQQQQILEIEIDTIYFYDNNI